MNCVCLNQIMIDSNDNIAIATRNKCICANIFFIVVETTSQEFICYCMIGIEAIG